MNANRKGLTVIYARNPAPKKNVPHTIASFLYWMLVGIAILGVVMLGLVLIGFVLLTLMRWFDASIGD
jgi:hypothetical protein